MRKVSAIICAIIIICSLIVIPCVAVGVYPTQNNTFSGIQTLNPSDGWTFENSEAVADIVEKAYKLNYFASGIPVAIYSINQSIAVAVAPYVNYTPTTTTTGSIYNGYTPPTIGVSRNNVQGIITNDTIIHSIRAMNSLTGEYYPVMIYLLNQDKTFFPASAIATTEYSLSIEMKQKINIGVPSDIIAVRYGENDWRTPYAQGYSDVDTQIESLGEWYDDQLTPTIINNYEYQLDIPGIITAIPNGAKQIINNAFGFEIFGINVAGLLSVLLIVAIVAFVVKWLMSR